MRYVAALVAAVMLASLVTLVKASPEEIKIATVDTARAGKESKAGRKADELLRKEYERLSAPLKEQRAEIDKLEEELRRKAGVLKSEETERLAGELKRRGRDLRRKLEDSDAELQKRSGEVWGEVIKGLSKVIQEIGDREGYTLIVELGSRPVLYSSRTIDITDQVIKEFDAKSG